jgi:hypothetical protein
MNRCLLGGVLGTTILAAAALAAGEADVAFFREQVKPVLEKRCLSCHAGEKPQGGLLLTTRAGLMKGGASGPAVSAGKPDESLLLAAINHRGRRMPPQGKLPQDEIDLLTRWVRAGAPWEGVLSAPGAHAASPQVNEETRRFWSFQPVRIPPLPPVKARQWVANPIDQFVLHRLEQAGLSPNPPADRTVLIRRATYDLTGLPPTAADVKAFVEDRSPDAWEKVVDRLLASPHYGVRWGRHWLDLVRFAESNSYERDGTKPFAWRYRDYVIDAFNNDKPYDRFILEQLAGDELSPRTAELLIATGYYRLGIWDDEPADPEQALYDDLDDILSTTGQVFLGLTVGCARCHEHKLDPMPQRDYYRLLSFFSGVRRYGVRSEESVAEASLRPISPEEDVRRHQAAVQAHRAALEANAASLKPIEEQLFADLSPVEKEEWRNPLARLQIAEKRVPRLLSREELERFRTLFRERGRLMRNPPRGLEMALAVTEIGARPREFAVLARGSAHAPGEKVSPGFPTVLGVPDPVITPPPSGESSGRRLALAQWIASPRNPLTARVMVNRVWQYHFGRGIVRSSSNFGLAGDRPTHPELLDWLAHRFVSGGWRLKPLHRLIMLSSTYRMSSGANPRAQAKDPANDLFWRFDMRRLGAEEVRDTILAVNGSLNEKLGGPSFYPDLPQEVLAGQSRPGENWGRSSPEEQRRRSAYIFVKRSLVVPIIASFDGADTDFTCPIRFSTTQPTQALGLLNSAWSSEQARIFADLLVRDAGEDRARQVELGLRRALQRPPTAPEIERGVRLIRDMQEKEGKSPREALSLFCLAVINLNEFVYLD